MSKLFLKFDDVTLNTYTLDKEETTIGRKSDNDIQLNDAVASSYHAKLKMKPNEYLDNHYDFFIEDTNSTNGTTVNGQVIRSVQLRDGDDIQIGNHHFIFDSEQSEMMDETAIYIPDND